MCWLGGDRAPDFSHGELLPFATQLYPYYTVILTGVSNIHVMVMRPPDIKLTIVHMGITCPSLFQFKSGGKNNNRFKSVAIRFT